MTDIPNTEYITINKDGVFVGGKPATIYRGENIKFIHDIKANFVAMQKQNPEVQELYAGAFETKGEYAKPGIPSGKFGPYAWYRAKLSDGRLGPWVFSHTNIPACDCAKYCAYNCGNYVRLSTMRSAVLNILQKQK